MNDINVLKETSVNKNTFIKKGYILLSESSLKGKNTKSTKKGIETNTPVIAVGGVYQKSNISRSYINLNNIGTLIGTLEIESSMTPYNNIQTIIPGQYPSISGPWTETQEKYNLQTIYDYLESNTNNFFCKILGLGLGEIKSYKVSEVSKNGISTINSNNGLSQDNQGFTLSQSEQQATIINYSSITPEMKYPESLTGTSLYFEGYDWLSAYGIDSINGTNTFPFFGWAGSRIGTLKPQNFQFLQGS